MRLSRILVVTAVFLSVIATLALLRNIQPAKANPTIYTINAGGDIVPPNLLISTTDKITYTLLGNISGAIAVQRSNIVLDGAGYTLEAPENIGIELISVSNVTVKNTQPRLFNYGIYLGSSSNCTLSDNTVSQNSGAGIELSFSSNCTLSGNNVPQNSGIGIALYSSCYNNTLSGNTVVGNARGFDIWNSSNNNTLSNNNATGNTSHNFYIFNNSNNNTLSGNTASGIGGTQYGIEVRQSSNNTLLGNNVGGNIYGISLRFFSNNNALSGNNMTGDGSYGVFVYYSSNNNTLSGNTVTGTNNNAAVFLNNVTYNTLSNNNVSGNYGGVYLTNSSYNALSGNSITGNQHLGVQVTSPSSNNTLLDNSITGNGGTGVSIDSCPGSILSRNNVTGNGAGILIDSCPGSTLSGNNASGNTGNGIYLYYSANSMLSDNTASGNNFGFEIYSCSNSIFSGNNASGNTYGFYLQASSKSVLLHNVIDNSGFYNFAVWGSTLDEYINSIDTSNLINGKPVYYYVNQSDLEIDSKDDPGYLALINCTKITVEGLSLTKNGAGIHLVSTSNSTITGNNLVSDEYGVYLQSSYNNTLSNNDASRNSYNGIYLWYSYDNTVSGNNASGNGYYGVALDYSSYNTLSGNNASGNTNYGLRLEASNNNELSDNNATKNVYGIYLQYSSYNMLTGNNASGNNNDGIYLESSSGNTLTGNDASENTNLSGIYLASSPDCTLSGNTASGNGDQGFYITYSDNTTLSGNTASGNTHGIYLVNCASSTLLNNLIDNNAYNLEIYGYDLNTYTYSIDTSNLINGKPVYYYVSQSDLVINPVTHPSVGYLALVDCTNITVEGLNLTKNGAGILLAYTTSSTITGNNFDSNDHGVYLAYSWQNTVSGNNATGNSGYGVYLSSSDNNMVLDNNVSANMYYGISVEDSYDNTVSGNNVSENGYAGIFVGYCSYNTVSDNNVTGNVEDGVYLDNAPENTVSDNEVSGNGNRGILLYNCNDDNVLGNIVAGNLGDGVYLYGSSTNTVSGNNVTGNGIGIGLDYSFDNAIYNNNFIDNTQQVYIGTSGYTNVWDAGYPSGGNYWSDYTGVDENHDGIGDTPYVIDPDNQDNYPLMNKWPPLQDEAYFDFGTDSSPVETGYTQVTNITDYSYYLGYGWSSTDNLVSRDRGAPDDLRRDFVFGNRTEGTFNVDLANGEYMVTVIIGDQSYMHDKINVYAEGILVINELTVPAGSFQEASFRVTITDEQLNLRFIDGGGIDPNWVLNALTIQVAPPLPTEAKFDFGTGSSPVEAGYTQVTDTTAYSALSGYGWSNIAGLDSRDRGAPDDLRRDLVFSSTEHTFNVDIANGEYLVTIIIGDQNFMHDQIDVYAEGNLVINDLTALGGSFQEVSFRVTNTDGQLNLRILDDGGTDTNWVLNAITIVVAPPLPTEAKFDFGTSGSPVEAGYTQVTSTTAYSASLGYGWSNTAGLDSRDRSSPDDLRRDFVFSSTEHTFNVDLANGDYQITIIIGDQAYAHDQIYVYAENILKIEDLSTEAGSFQQTIFFATVADGQLNLRILDTGGTDPNWVIDSIAVEPGSPPTLPTSASFDFGTSSSPVEAGYTQVTANTAYSAISGYGWSNAVGLDSRDRIEPDNLRRDFVFGGTDHTFNVDLANGQYTVTLIIGDNDYAHDLIDVYAEGILQVNHLTVDAGTFSTQIFTVTVSDNQLNIGFHDAGGSDPNWVINAIGIEPAV